MGKAPAHKPDNPSSDPRTHFSLAEKEGGKAERWIPEPQWPVSLAKVVTFRFTERPCFKKKIKMQSN